MRHARLLHSAEKEAASGQKKRGNKYPNAFRQMALERMKSCESVSELADELGIHRTVLYHWKHQLKAIDGGTPSSPIRELRKEVAI